MISSRHRVRTSATIEMEQTAAWMGIVRAWGEERPKRGSGRKREHEAGTPTRTEPEEVDPGVVGRGSLALERNAHDQKTIALGSESRSAFWLELRLLPSRGRDPSLVARDEEGGVGKKWGQSPFLLVPATVLFA